MTGDVDCNPFVGPRSLQQGEALYGRDTEVRDLYNRLQARRIVVLHSPSGAGKSSLIQAGLIPKLEQGGFDVWKPIRLNLEPRELGGVPEGSNRYLLSAMVSLEDGVCAQDRRSPAQLAGMDLRTYLDERSRREGHESRRVVLLFDQFEEVLTVAPGAIDEKRAFFGALGQALESEHYWALFALREDYLAAFAPYRDRIPTHMSHTFRLDLFGRDGAKEAALQLARNGTPSRTFPAVDKLVRDLSTIHTHGSDGQVAAEEGRHVEPVYLQVVGRQLWAKMPPDELAIDARHLEDYADVTAVLGGYYADAVRKVAAGDQAVERTIRDWVRSNLIASGIRSQVRRGSTKSAGLDNALIDRLVDSYVVRMEHRAGASWFELSHDRLVKPIEQDSKAWERSHLHSSQVQARLWETGGRSRALLLAAEALEGAQEALRKHEAFWTRTEKEFLAESRQVRDEEARRRRQLRATAVVLAIALVGALVASIVAYRQSIVAMQQKQIADASSDAAHDAKIASYEEQARLAAIGGTPGAALAYLGEVYRDGYRDPKRDLWTARFLLAGLSRSMSFLLLRGIDRNPSAMVFSADGGRVASVAGQGRPQVWDRRTGRLLAALEGHAQRVHGMAFSPDGQTVATASEDGSVRLFEAQTGRPVMTVETNAEPVHSVAFSDDGRLLAIGSASGTVRLRDGRGGQLLAEASGPEHAVFALAFSHDGATVAGAGQDGVVWLWSVASGEATARFELSPLPIRALGFAPDGDTLAAAGDDWYAHLVALPDGSHRALVAHTGPIRALSFSPDGATLASASDDGTVRLWPREPAPVPIKTPERPAPPAPSRRIDGHTGAVLAVAFVHDSQTSARGLATAGSDGTARLWIPDRLLAQLDGHAGAVRAVAFSPDARTVATASEDGTALLFAVDGGRPAGVLEGPGGPLYKIAYSPDGQTVAVAGESSTALLFRKDGGPPFGKLEGHTARIRAISFAADGTTLATASEDGTARIWPAVGGPAIAVLDAQQDALRAVAFAPDGKTVATVGVDPKVRIWSARGGAPLAVLEGHEDVVLSLAFSSDGKTLATASKDGTARLWLVAGRRLLATLEGHRGPVGTIVFSPDDATVATAGADGTSVLWAARDGALRARLSGHADTVNAVAFSPDGRMVATASSDGSARIWDVGGRLLAILEGHWNYVWGVAFSPSGDRLATASEDGTARLWQLRLEDRPPAEVARQIACRIPWNIDRGALVPVLPDGSLCEEPRAAAK